MKVSSFYSILVTPDMDKMLKRFAKTGSLRLKHHLTSEEFDYYVMVDNSGNNTDFIQFKNQTMKDGFYAVRMNVDNFEEMANILFENNFEIEGDIYESETAKFARLISKNNEPSIVLVEHKK